MATDTTNEDSGGSDNNIKRSIITVFRWVEWSWTPEKGWHAHRAEAAKQIPEEPANVLDPETILWNRLYEETRNDPPVDLQPRALDEEVRPRQSKRMCCRHFETWR